MGTQARYLSTPHHVPQDDRLATPRRAGRRRPVADPPRLSSGNPPVAKPKALKAGRTSRDRKPCSRREQHLQDFINGMACYVGVLTPAGVVVQANRATLKAGGFAIGDLVGRHFADFYGWSYSERVQADLREAIARAAAGHTVRYDVELRMRECEFMALDLSIVPLCDEQAQVTHLLASAIDITERKRAEQSLKALETQLNQAQKMEAVGRLAGGVAHDFNNLLTAIIGYTQMMMQRLAADSPAHHEAAEVLKAGERAAALTGQLLLFSRQKATERKPADLNGVIGGLMKMLRRIIGEDIEVRVLPGAGLPQVLADPAQLEQVIMNLAVNARDAMPTGGTLTIETRALTLDAAYCRTVVGARPGKYVQLSVTDTGQGMDAETQQHIFEPFFTTKGPGEGTGLGLSVVYGILQKHEGFVHVYSQQGQGTTFKVYVPVYKGSHDVQLPNRPEPVRGGSETILVAEDEPILRNIAEAVLANLGYKVILARDGIEALEASKRHGGEIDLILMDMVMPRMGGGEAFNGLEAMGCEAPVIFMTGYSPEAPQSEFVRQRSLELIQKPYSPDHLALVVRRVLDARRA